MNKNHPRNCHFIHNFGKISNSQIDYREFLLMNWTMYFFSIKSLSRAIIILIYLLNTIIAFGQIPVADGHLINVTPMQIPQVTLPQSNVPQSNNTQNNNNSTFQNYQSQQWVIQQQMQSNFRNQQSGVGSVPNINNPSANSNLSQIELEEYLKNIKVIEKQSEISKIPIDYLERYNDILTNNKINPKASELEKMPFFKGASLFFKYYNVFEIADKIESHKFSEAAVQFFCTVITTNNIVTFLLNPACQIILLPTIDYINVHNNIKDGEK